MRARLGLGTATLLFVGVLALGLTESTVVGQNANPTGVITGVVASPQGPEAGVWVIAETSDLPTKFRKIVVTNDEGKFVLPELPTANYKVWVRGYGLVDAAPVMAAAGQDLELAAVVAPSAAAAAKVYPANYWLSLLEPPDQSEFPGTGPTGNNISPNLETHDEFMFALNGCMRCHQLGTEFMRTLPTENHYSSSEEAWDQRVLMGQRAGEMSGWMSSMGRRRGLEMFADWTDRIAAGEIPEAPPRPKGIERNVVLTQWEWTNEMGKIHDEVSTDKRNPTLNAYGPVYGVDIANDNLSILDPRTNTTKLLRIPTIEDRMGMRSSYAPTENTRVANLDRFNPTSIHNPMMDAKGRVWYTATLRPRDAQPEWCKQDSTNKYSQYYEIENAGRNVSFYDPQTEEFTMLDTCFGTHHLQFAQDDKVYFNGESGVFSWIDTREFDRTGSAQRSQGWCPIVVDTNGDGRITKPWNEPTNAPNGGGEDPIAADEFVYEAFDPTRDTSVPIGSYSVIENPVDGSIWGAEESYPGRIVRMTIGDNPPESCISEVFEVPSERMGLDPSTEQVGFKPRGVDVDSSGVIWTALAATSHMASFDYRKCEASGGTSGYDGQWCKEGWTLYPLPGPTYKGTSRRVDFHYYNWVDQFNALGLGADVPIATGTSSDSLIALLPGTREPIHLRVPYPLGGFHPRGMDGRIDDPDAGWKGRGVWSSTGADTVWHAENGMEINEDGQRISVSMPILVKFQIRPDPLAR